MGGGVTAAIRGSASARGTEAREVETLSIRTRQSMTRLSLGCDSGEMARGAGTEEMGWPRGGRGSDRLGDVGTTRKIVAPFLQPLMAGGLGEALLEEAQGGGEGAEMIGIPGEKGSRDGG